mmetsp:Transcript_171082/g.548254  ORF Transcript_171082/g.548254 Transcript_171082/m.548254 type:complete len:395 (+) Transcript_171082:127-1311(+)|eukprot:CAMPEP_0203904012 /NCGR_PEP_ID=MMETSP0359-20131031/45883_1 /ASSEMBLY_ACC=CAM_ASM_000338 /TAXON_ID=268821 /ORGANISM="Scrippsiella Hangoei, Strain SHTV-5" /LENGTH=394 /DNA_ID=CAMNT_0050828159 /DNA_START=51 /DNA_END=1235 /DNA_ORIENTATION=-
MDMQSAPLSPPHEHLAPLLGHRSGSGSLWNMRLAAMGRPVTHPCRTSAAVQEVRPLVLLPPRAAVASSPRLAEPSHSTPGRISLRAAIVVGSAGLAGLPLLHRRRLCRWRLLRPSLPRPRGDIATFRRAAAVGEDWNGDQSQLDLMEADHCLLVDEDDNILGSTSKAAAHRCTFPAGPPERSLKLHRAFSVFLFDEQGRLLLQQRSRQKITFPLVWTNTCCSHPLHGQRPPEVDLPADVAAGTVPGIKRAAIRKLGHELGIPASQLPPESFKFLTRLHYCATDKTEPEPGMWGEHELDYVLLLRAAVDLQPNIDEVDAVRYVTFEELQDMLDARSGLSWSPWFRILVEHFLPSWWDRLDDALGTDGFVDGRIHHMDLVGKDDPMVAPMGSKLLV